MKAGLIAAGMGERMRAGGVFVPKPLIAVGGRPLVDHVLDAVAAAGIVEAACIFNAEPAFDAVEAHCRARPGPPRLRILRRTTPNSMESLFALAPFLAGAPFLALTVDAVFAPADLRAFLAAALALPDQDVVLALTDFVDDEAPLRVALGDDGRVTAMGAGAGNSPLATAGFYFFNPRIFAEAVVARTEGLGALRQLLAHLRARGYRCYGVRIGKTVDVDRPEDIAVAEAFVRSEIKP